MLKDIYHLDSVQSFFEKGGWFDMGENLQAVLNALINIVFGLIKYIVLALDYVIEKLFNLNLLEGVLPSLFSTASSIYLKLFEVLGILIFTFVLVLMVKDFFEKGVAKALTRLGIFLLIYFGSLAFFQDGATKIQEVNTISQNVQGQLVDLTSGSLSSSPTSTSDKLLGDTSNLDGTSKIRNLIFDEFILRPYALLNFGKTDLSKEEFDQYLVKSSDAYDSAKVKEVKQTIKKNAEENSYLTSDRMTEKIAVLLNALVMLVVIGTAVLIIGVANVLIQLLIYALIFLFPSLLFLALIPNMHHLLKNGVMLLGSLFAGKVGLGFGFGLLFSIINLLDSFFVVTNIVTMLVGLFVKVLLGLFIWKNKGQILRSLTKGKAELKDFQFRPGKDWGTRKQRKQDKQDKQNRYSEQAYKTDTAENDYFRSGLELERAYRMNELEDQLLVQAGQTEAPVPPTETNEPVEYTDTLSPSEDPTLDNEVRNTSTTDSASSPAEGESNWTENQLNEDSFSESDNRVLATEEVDDFLLEQSEIQEDQTFLEASNERTENTIDQPHKEEFEVPSKLEPLEDTQEKQPIEPIAPESKQSLTHLSSEESQAFAEELNSLRNQPSEEDVYETS